MLRIENSILDDFQVFAAPDTVQQQRDTAKVLNYDRNVVYPVPYVPHGAFPHTDAQRDFIYSTPLGLEGNQKKWTGVRLLGEGGNGIVGLWR